MGDPRGFLKVRTRRELAERPVEERIKDWLDVHAESGLQPWTTEQAARCMDCGTPFCMTGCPLGNIIPEFNDLVRQEKWEDAYNRLSTTNNFPEVTGRICPALCEKACVLGIHQPPTMIKLDEQTIIDQAWGLDIVKPMPPQRLTDQTVAVVGSGPAGLACAQQLTRAGHTVVVYERDDAIGGLMRYGIPNFKLDKRLIDRRIKQMEAEGTRFRTGVEIGKDISWDDLRDRYDAVVVAIGSTVPRDMKIPGRELKGIHFAMEFLPDATRRVYGVKPVHDITAKDKHVIIIGGGDTGSDCLGTSIRQGAKDVTVLQIMPKEPDERPDNQPWPTFARLYQKTSSMEEGGTYVYSTDSVNFVGSDEEQARVHIEDSTASEGFVADENGHVTGLKVVDVGTGRSPASPVPNACCPRIWCSSRSASCTRTPPRCSTSCLSNWTSAATWPATTSSPPLRMACSLPATRAAARVWSCGPFRRAAPAQPPLMSTSPASPSCPRRSPHPSVR